MELEMSQILVALHIAGILITCSGFIMIKFNDLRHLAKDFKRVEVKLESLEKAVNKNTTNLATIETRCKERHNQ